MLKYKVDNLRLLDLQCFKVLKKRFCPTVRVTKQSLQRICIFRRNLIILFIEITEQSILSELKIVDFNYFHSISYF